MTERSMTSVLDDLQRRGFTRAFGATAQGLRVLGSDRTLGRGEFVIVEHHRFEGISDPDDMAVVYAIEANDGTRGTLVDGFGAYADPGVGAALQGIADRAEDRPTELPMRARLSQVKGIGP